MHTLVNYHLERIDLKIIANLRNKINNERKILLQTILCCAFACFLLGTNVSYAEVGVERDLIPEGITEAGFDASNNDAFNNIEEEILPSKKVRIFIDKKHNKLVGEKLHILYLGYLSQLKGIFDLFDVAKKAQENDSSILFLISGDFEFHL